MEEQDFLNESDIDALINLLLRSQQSRTREALCFSIGIDPKRLSFLRDSSDSDFYLLLIRHLNEIGEQEALCKLCCKELFPVFHHGKYASILSDIVARLNCNQESNQNYPNNKQPTVPSSIPTSRVSVNHFNELHKSKLIAGGVIIIFCLSGYSLYKQINTLNNNENEIEQPVAKNPTPIEQSESTTLDYTRLQKLLSEEDWKGADQETTNIMFSLSKRKNEIRTDDLENFSCQVLDKIDQLWRNASKNYFGFSIQNEIWQREREQNPFENAVGWSVKGQFIENNPELIRFSLSAPKGHLPTVLTLVDTGHARSMGEIERKFFTHITSCPP